MLSEIQAIHTHLWVLTALLSIMVVGAGYCNYSRLKERNSPPTDPDEVMKEMWEKGQFSELQRYASTHLREWPNSENALRHKANSLYQLGELSDARVVAVHLASISPMWRHTARELIEMIDERAGS